MYNYVYGGFHELGILKSPQFQYYYLWSSMTWMIWGTEFRKLPYIYIILHMRDMRFGLFLHLNPYVPCLVYSQSFPPI